MIWVRGARAPAKAATPTLVLWGAADRVVSPEHGQAYADAIPDARLDLIETAGHLPQIETPQRLLDDVWAFTSDHHQPEVGTVQPVSP